MYQNQVQCTQILEYFSGGKTKALEYFQLTDMRYHDRNVVTKRDCTIVLHLYLQLVPAIFYQIFIFAQNDSPLKTMKNVFYFI